MAGGFSHARFQLVETLKADVRIPMEERRQDGQRILCLVLQGKYCCTGIPVFTLFRSHAIATVDDIFKEVFQSALMGLTWVKSYLMSIADCERRHLRTRRLNTGNNMVVQNYCARSLCEDLRAQEVSGAGRVALLAGALGESMPAEAEQVKKITRSRSTSGYDMYKRQRISEARVDDGANAKQLCFTKSGRQSMFTGYTNLNVEEKAAYTILAAHADAQVNAVQVPAIADARSSDDMASRPTAAAEALGVLCVAVAWPVWIQV